MSAFASRLFKASVAFLTDTVLTLLEFLLFCCMLCLLIAEDSEAAPVLMSPLKLSKSAFIPLYLSNISFSMEFTTATTDRKLHVT